MATTIEDTLETLHRGIDQLRTDLRKRARESARTIRKEAPAIVKRGRALSQDLADDGLDYAHDWIAAGRKAWDSASESVEELRENAIAAAARARGALSEVASQADFYGKSSTKQVRQFVRERPVTSLLVAAAAGMVLSRLFARD